MFFRLVQLLSCLICPFKMVSTDMTHFLLPTSRLPKDVTFIVGEYPVFAHKGILAAAHPFFEKMFFDKEFGTSRVKVRS